MTYRTKARIRFRRYWSAVLFVLLGSGCGDATVGQGTVEIEATVVSLQLLNDIESYVGGELQPHDMGAVRVEEIRAGIPTGMVRPGMQVSARFIFSARKARVIEEPGRRASAFDIQGDTLVYTVAGGGIQAREFALPGLLQSARIRALVQVTNEGVTIGHYTVL